MKHKGYHPTSTVIFVKEKELLNFKNIVLSEICTWKYFKPDQVLGQQQRVLGLRRKRLSLASCTSDEGTEQ